MSWVGYENWEGQSAVAWIDVNGRLRDISVDLWW